MTNRQDTLDTFCDDPAEVHAVVIGIYYAMNKITGGRYFPEWSELPEGNMKEVLKEYPYFLFGILVVVLVYLLLTYHSNGELI